MSKDYANIKRLYHVMVELLNAPKVKDIIMKMPSHVKDGKVIDFNGRSFGDTDMADGAIFPKPERVHNCQAVTSALKRDYTKALKEWLDEEQGEGQTNEDVAEKPKTKKKAPTTDDDAVEQDVATPTLDLVGEVKKLLKADNVKGAKKLLKANKEHPKFDKAKKKYDKAVA